MREMNKTVLPTGVDRQRTPQTGVYRTQIIKNSIGILIVRSVFAFLVIAGAGLATAQGEEETPVAFTGDGAWCWFQDPRAVYVEGERMRTYAQWMTREGKLQVGAFDHATGQTEFQTLEPSWGRDDHNVGAFVVLPDKRLMVFYARHNKRGIFSRTTANPEDIITWDERIVISETDRISYAHPVYLRTEKRFYVFWRGPSWKPTFATSDDGRIWSEPRILIQDLGREDRAIRPYTKITSDGKSTIHIAFTDGHPRNEAQNSVYYLRYEAGNFFKADGTIAGGMEALPVQHSQSDVVYDGKATNVRAWVWDIALDADGHPVIAYTRHPDESDHRYHCARWNGAAWNDVEVTPGGGWFPKTIGGKKEREPHYSGGMALDHEDPSTLYVSRPINGMFEIERWQTPDGGASWTSLPVTQNSDLPNVRPVVPRGGSGVLWMHGSYEHYTRYRTGIRFAP